MKARNVSLRVVCACAATVLLAGAGAPADVLIDGDGLVQNEISLTTVPGQAGTVVMAYNDDPYSSGPGLGIAHRQGALGAWTTTQILTPTFIPPLGGPPVIMARSFDPTITADSSGNVYAGFIADNGAGDSAMAVSVSADFGQTWGLPVAVALDPPPVSNPDPNYRFNDRCQITSDTVSSGAYAGNVYLAWIKDRGLNQPQPWGDIWFATSATQGATWTYPNPHPVTTEQIINDNPGTDLANIPIPTVARDGTVYVAWLDYNVITGGQGRIMLDRSTDGGVSWGADQLVSTINLPPLNVTTQVPSATDALAKGGTPIAADPTNANDLYIVYAEDTDPTDADEADIFLIRSTNGGVAWSAPVKVNHDDSSSGDNILPWIDVKHDGTIDVAWYDRRNDPNDVLWDVYIAKSTDGGQSFSANVKISDAAFATPANLWLGEYLGLAVDSSNAYLAWTSSKSDAARGDVYFDQIDNRSIPEPATLVLITLGATAILRRRRDSQGCRGFRG